MHLFTGHHPRNPRFFANFDLPDNPICWVKGHTPRVKVLTPKYMDPYLVVRCLICDSRHNPDTHKIFSSSSWKERAAKTLEIYQSDPVSFVKHYVDKRDDWTQNTLELSAEFSFPKKPQPEFSFRLHTGGRGSESPYDAHFTLFGYGVYLGIGGLTGRWAEFIGRGHGRDISLSAHGGQLWWKLWYDGDGGNDEHHRCDSWRQPKLWPWSRGRQKYRPWMCLRNGNIELNPVNAWYGSRKWVLIDETEPREAVVDIGQFHADEYVAMFNLEYRDVKREAGPAWAQRVKRHDISVKWDASCVGGIPYRNHDWKGDEVISGHLSRSVLDGWNGTDDWLPLAVEALKQNIIRDRERYQYRPPKPADAAT